MDLKINKAGSISVKKHLWEHYIEKVKCWIKMGIIESQHQPAQWKLDKLISTLLDNTIKDIPSITWLVKEIKIVQTNFEEDLKIK